MSLTYNDVVRALECCAELFHDITTCEECPFEEIETPVCVVKSVTDALDLINRQKAQIEKLQKSNRNWRRKCQRLRKGLRTQKAEIERLTV